MCYLIAQKTKEDNVFHLRWNAKNRERANFVRLHVKCGLEIQTSAT